MEIMCFDGKGWLAPALGGTEDSRQREDAKQQTEAGYKSNLSGEDGALSAHTHTHAHSVISGVWELRYPSHQVNDFRTRWEQRRAKVITTVE